MEGPTVIKFILCGECEHVEYFSPKYGFCTKLRKVIERLEDDSLVTPKDCPFRENVVV